MIVVNQSIKNRSHDLICMLLLTGECVLLTNKFCSCTEAWRRASLFSSKTLEVSGQKRQEWVATLLYIHRMKPNLVLSGHALRKLEEKGIVIIYGSLQV